MTLNIAFGLTLVMASFSGYLVNAQVKCSKINSCSCSYGQSYVDLSPLASKQGPRFADQWDSHFMYQFSFNPCLSFTEGSCKDVAACLIVARGGAYYEVGSQSSATFINDPHNDQLTLRYTSTDSNGYTRTSKVLLNCTGADEPDSLHVIGETQPGVNEFILNSYHCCAKIGSGFDRNSTH